MFTKFEMRTYRHLRKEGRTATSAFHVVKSMRDAAAVLTENDYIEGAPHGTPWGGYDIDVAKLRTITGADVPDEYTARLYVYRDEESNPAESECYDAEDIAAWKYDDWTYVGIVVVITRPDGATAESALWGIEQGSHWPGTPESQVWHAVPDSVHEALAWLENTPPTAMGKLSLIKALLPVEDEDLASEQDLINFCAEVREVVGG